MNSLIPTLLDSTNNRITLEGHSIFHWLNNSGLLRKNSDFTVKVNNTPLERAIQHKSLEVQIDESLNWRPHIHTISKKISAGIAILRRVSHFIKFDTRVNMNNALVIPYFNYCGAVWGIIIHSKYFPVSDWFKPHA